MALTHNFFYNLNEAPVNCSSCTKAPADLTFTATMDYEVGDVGEGCGEQPGQIEVKIMWPQDGLIVYQQQVNGGTSGPLSLLDTVTLPYPGTYTIQVTFSLCGQEDNPIMEYYEITLCPAVTVTEGECGKFTISNETNAAIDLTITDADGGVVVSTTIESGVSYEVTITEDGAYRITYTYLGDEEYTYFVPLISVCKIANCVKELIKKVLCANEDDPCCKSCNEEEAKKNRLYRDELNKIIALWGVFLIANTDLVKNLQADGTYLLTDAKLAEIKSLDEVIVKLRKLAAKCGVTDCEDSSSTGGCSSCS